MTGVLRQTTLGPLPEGVTGPSVWRGLTQPYRTMWLTNETCGACFGPMELVPFGRYIGSLSATWRCIARVEPIGYSNWNECRPGGRLYVEPNLGPEQERLW